MEISINILKSLWKAQLEKEYDKINWSYRLKLIRPHIKIVEVNSYFGQWDPLLREIKISFYLIQNNKWPIVLEILKHEMAHQLVTDSNSNETGHGPIFKSFCQKLGIDQRFQRAQSEISLSSINFDTIKNVDIENVSDETQKLLQRIEKLLSLAQSDNQNEALSAMEKVNDLYEKYNLDRIQTITKNKLYNYIIIDLGSSKVKTHYSIICTILKRHYYINAIFSDTYHPNSNTFTKTIELFGLHENLIVGEYIFHFLCRTIEDQWKAHSKNKSLAGRFKRSFQLGLLHGFYEKLNLSQKQRTLNKSNEDAKSLLLIKNDPDLQDFIHSHHPRLSKRTSSSGRVFGSAFSDGVENGKSIIINKGIKKESSKNKIYLLE